MNDPVVCVDGFTYERTNLEEWFRIQSSAKEGTAFVYTSPQTGQVLASTVMIRNINILEVIRFFTERMPKKSVDTVKAPLESSTIQALQPLPLLQFSKKALGKCVTLDKCATQVTRTQIHTDTAAWYEYIAFSAFPARITADQKPSVQFKIGKCRTGWGGLTVGLSPLSPDLVKVPDLTDFVDANCWWLDGNRWFHTPETGTTLVRWSTDELRSGDSIRLYVPESGRLCVYMNGIKKLDLKDTGIPLRLGSQLYGFVALTGGYEEVTIVTDQSRTDIEVD